MKPTNRAILETTKPATVIGARVTHRNAPERVGVITAEQGGQCEVSYTHEAEAGQTVNTTASYPLAELTLLP